MTQSFAIQSEIGVSLALNRVRFHGSRFKQESSKEIQEYHEGKVIMLMPINNLGRMILNQI